MHVHAGTVIGGSELRSGPHMPSSIKEHRFGIASRYRSNTNVGAAQSSPMTIIRGLSINRAISLYREQKVPLLGMHGFAVGGG